jgi:hypothetical protein
MSAAVVDDGSDRVLVIVNSIDLPQKWDGTVIAVMGVSAQFTAARFVFAQYGHVIYLVPTIAGSPNYQRAMWSEQFLTETVTPSNLAVTYTGERLITAGMVNDEIIAIFDRSVWKLRYTGDFRTGAQFTWEHIAGGTFDRHDSAGALAPMGSVALPDRLVSVSNHGIVEANGSRADESLFQVPDLMTKYLDPGRMEVSFGVAFDEEHKLIFSAVTLGAPDEEPNTALVLDMKTRAVSFYDWDYRVFGLYRRQAQVPTWDGVPWANTPFGEVTELVDSTLGTTGYPTILAGRQDAGIYEIPSITGVDEIGVSEMIIEYKEMNPFVASGRQVDFGHLALYASSSEDQDVTVSFYLNGKTSPAKEVTVNVSPTSNEEHVMRLIRVNLTADFVKIKISHSSNIRIAIDGLIPYMRAGAPLRRMAA